MTTDDRLARQVAIRLSDEDMQRLDTLTQQIPIASRNSGHNRSGRMGAATSQPREVRGAARLAANPTAKCPMNTVPS